MHPPRGQDGDTGTLTRSGRDDAKQVRESSSLLCWRVLGGGGAPNPGFGVPQEASGGGGSTNIQSPSLKLQMSTVSANDSSIRQLPALRVSD